MKCRTQNYPAGGGSYLSTMSLLIAMGALIAAVAGRAALLDPQTIANAAKSRFKARVQSRGFSGIGDICR